MYAQIYHAGTKFTKDPRLYTCFNEDESMFCYLDPRQAKSRKDVMSPLFSRRAIIKLENLIQDKVNRFLPVQILKFIYFQGRFIVERTVLLRGSTGQHSDGLSLYFR